jgi:8-oxo-dGTP diphosphatase
VISVVVAVIKNAHQHVLIAKRSNEKDHGGQWEFPGGKLESGESSLEALKRELYEELGIEVTLADFKGKIFHQYPQKAINFYIYEVLTFKGDLKPLDGQLDIRWVALNEIQTYDFPEANQKFINVLFDQKANKPTEFLDR